MNQVSSADDNIDIIWGGSAIAQAIGRKPRVTFKLLENGNIPGAKKVGGMWCITRRKLREAFEKEATL